jgi:large subunit ribosomal protein L15
MSTLKPGEAKLRPGSTKNSQRVGRGTASGRGKTSGRGHGGQGARAGHGSPARYEGGQMPLARRVPKRGFTSRKKIRPAVVNLSDLVSFAAGSKVGPQELKDRGILKGRYDGLKVLAKGELKNALTVQAHSFSREARRKIESGGGKAEVIGG